MRGEMQDGRLLSDSRCQAIRIRGLTDEQMGIRRAPGDRAEPPLNAPACGAVKAYCAVRSVGDDFCPRSRFDINFGRRRGIT